MKVRFNHWYNAVLTVLMSLLGYGCSSSSEEPMYGLVAEYGAPSTDYVIKGTVIDETGTPVQGIKTSLKHIYKDETKVYSNGLDSVKTDATGNYQLKYKVNSLQAVKLLVEDIDSEANGGEFLSDTLDIDQNKAVKVKDGDGHWYQGEFEISQDAQLKKKP